MFQIIPNYHPLLVHFTIALISTSLATLIFAWLTVRWSGLSKELFIVSRWCLWLGALAVIATVAAGFHAYYTVAHDSVTHRVMTIHRNWGLVTFVFIELMALWSIVIHVKKKQPRILFTSGMVIAFALVMATGWLGAELVYRYGTGVMSLPQTTGSGHQHTGEDNLLPTSTQHGQHDH